MLFSCFFKPLYSNVHQQNLICRWKYAIDSVLEVHIRRYTRMWSWSNIKKHRQLLKSYKSAYKNKLTQTKVPEEIQKQIQVYLACIGKLSFVKSSLSVNFSRFKLKDNFRRNNVEFFLRELYGKMQSVFICFFLLKIPS